MVVVDYIKLADVMLLAEMTKDSPSPKLDKVLQCS